MADVIDFNEFKAKRIEKVKERCRRRFPTREQFDAMTKDEQAALLEVSKEAKE